MYLNGECPTLELSEYASLTCDFLERLPSHMVIQRLTAEAPENILLAPRWTLKKAAVFNAINEEFKRRDSKQGRYFS